jgi:esterase/lipase superfamily enzyme
MSTYFVTNRVFRGGGFVDVPTPDGKVRVRRSDDSYDENFAHFQEVTADKAIKSMLQESKDLAAGKHDPLIVAFIHGFNNNIESALASTALIGKGLAANGVRAVMVCFSWPSDGQLWEYLSDQGDAKRSVPAMMRILDYLDRARDPRLCEVNVCVIAHSMGNLVLREGMTAFARRLGYPQFQPYLTEVLMVAADVDSDSLAQGGSGRGITSLSRRVTAYYSRYDDTLSVSRYGKHWGAARLGRNGPSDYDRLPRNVAAVDCTEVVQPTVGGIAGKVEELMKVHSAYWENPLWQKDAAFTLRSIDRKVITTREAHPELRGYPDAAYRLKPG